MQTDIKLGPAQEIIINNTDFGIIADEQSVQQLPVSHVPQPADQRQLPLAHAERGARAETGGQRAGGTQ